MKSRVKISSLLVFIFCVSLALSGYTYGINEVDDDLVLSEEAILFYQDLGCEISEDAVVEVLPIQSTSRSQSEYALCVTTNTGDQFQKDIYVFLNSNEEGLSVDSSIPMLARSSQLVDFDPYGFSGITMHGTAIYTSYGGGRYRPQGVSWYYTSTGSSYDVQFMSVRYDCEGSLVEYPGFAYISSPYEHSIEASADYPVARNSYSDNDPLSSMYAIDVAGGSPFAGMALTFNYTINNSSDGYTVGLTI